MVFRDQNAAVPVVARHHDQIVKMLHRFGGDGEICRALSRLLSNLTRRSLMNAQRNIRISLHEIRHQRRHEVARLGVRRRDRQRALHFIAVFLAQLPNTVAFTQDLAANSQNFFTRRCNVGQVLAVAGKDFNAQLVFKQANLLADAWLRGEQALSGSRDIQVVPSDFPDIAKLLKFHSLRSPCSRFSTNYLLL